MKMWFYESESKFHVKHRRAYEESLHSDRPVKVYAGMYYYHGYEVEKSGGTEYPWNYRKPNETEVAPVKTRYAAFESIDQEVR